MRGEKWGSSVSRKEVTIAYSFPSYFSIVRRWDFGSRRLPRRRCGLGVALEDQISTGKSAGASVAAVEARTEGARDPCN